jgi:hypothetical protein
MKISRAALAIVGAALLSLTASTSAQATTVAVTGSVAAVGAPVLHRPHARVPAPVRISGFSVRNHGTSLEVKWYPAARATGYKIVWKDARTGEVLPARKGSSPYSSVIELKWGIHAYKVSVTGYNRAGAGPTAKASTTAERRAPVPGAVRITGFEARAQGTGLEVTWRPAFGAAGYRVVWKDETGAVIPSRQGTSEFSSLISINSGTHDYTVWITPYNRAGRGPTATASHTATGRAPLPGAVRITGFEARAQGTGLEVAWRPATDATGYKVVWKDETGTVITANQGTSQFSSLIAVKAGTHTYTVSITPSNGSGDGPTATASHTATGRTS